MAEATNASVNHAWLYIDTQTKAQKGPIPEHVLIKLLEKGIGVTSNTLVWKAGMTSWLPVAEVDGLKDVVEFQSRQWYYLDHDNQQQGPIATRFLLHKLKEGDLDGLSMVYCEKVGSWKKIGEIEELKQEIQKIHEQEEALLRAKEAAETLASEEVQVFFFEDNEQPKIPDTFFKSSSNVESADQKFESDDGNKYRWDDEEQEWVVDDNASIGEANGHNDDDHMSTDDEQQERSEKNRNKKRKTSDNPADSEDEEKKPSTAEDSNTTVDGESKPKKRRSKKKKKKAPNTWVYVSGLPGNVTFEEIKDHFSKVGLIALSPHDQQPRIKIYVDDITNECKGDCSICYNAEESVKFAVDILHGGYIRPSHQISVTRANFESQDHFDRIAQSKPKSRDQSSNSGSGKVTQAQIKVARSAAKQALSWNEDDDSGIATKSSALKIVVLEGMFHPKDLLNDEDDQFVSELEKDVAGECEKIGEVEKITMFSKNIRGIIVVKFHTAFAAQECIRVMNGRFFGGQKIKCYYWDGATNYSIVGTADVSEELEEKQEEARLNEFGDWLEKEQEELPEEFQLKTEE